MQGTRGIGLCARCDNDDPVAHGLLAFFAVHETITDTTVESAAALIDEWTRRVAVRPDDTAEAAHIRQAGIDDEAELWLRGEM